MNQFQIERCAKALYNSEVAKFNLIAEPWEKLPDSMKSLHRFRAKIVIEAYTKSQLTTTAAN